MNKYSIYFCVQYMYCILYLPIAAHKRYLHQRGILRRERASHGHRNHGATAVYFFDHFNTFHASEIPFAFLPMILIKKKFCHLKAGEP